MIFYQGLHVIAYRAMLDVSRELAEYLSGLLQAERVRRGTRTGSRALTCFRHAVLVLRWFRQGADITALARDHGVSRATGYRYIDEAIRVLAAQAPDLHQALARAADHESAYVVLDGKVFAADRCGEKSISVKGAEIDAWLHEDAGETAQAQQLIREAMEWAYEADDRAMLAWTLFRRSNQAASQGDGAQTISLVQAAQRNERALSSPMRAALAQQQAHGFALDGDEVAAHRLLDHALGWATSDTAGDAREGHGAFCTETYLQRFRG